MMTAYETQHEAQGAIRDVEGRVERARPAVLAAYRRAGMTYEPGIRCDTTQGRCAPCKIVYHWRSDKSLRLAAAKCPDCGGALVRTSQPIQRDGRMPLADHLQVAVTGADRAKLRR
jgi:hypothetical protein